MQLSHAGFVTDWAPLPRTATAAVDDAADLPPHAADLLKVVSERVAVP
jgi:hypothetical protein